MIIKGKISLKDGTIVDVECESVTEFGNLINAMKHDGFLRAPSLPLDTDSKKPVLEVLRPKTLGRPPKVKNGRPKHYKKRNQLWSQNDIVGIGKIVRDNAQVKNGLSALVKDYIDKTAENRKRTAPVIYTITSDLRSYFNGRENSVGDRIKVILDDAGLYPLGKN